MLSNRSWFLMSCLVALPMFPHGIAAAQPEESTDEEVTARGVIRDARTGAPVVGATVYAIGADEEALTDERGAFTLHGAGISAVTVISEQHQPATAELRGSSVEVRLEPLRFAEDSAEVISVQGERPPAAPGATTVARQELTRIPGTRGDTLSGVKNLPGVANNGALTPGSGGLVIRGSSPEDSRILVDGFEIPILYHFLGVQSVLPSEMIDDIEYLPGAYGPEFGRASAGVVSVRSRRDAVRTGGFAELSFVNAAGLVEGRLGDRGSFAVAARRSIIDAILPAVIPDDANLSFTAYPRYYDYQARADYQVTEGWQLSGFLFGSADKVELLNDNDNAADPVATGRFANDASFTRAIVSAEYRRPVGSLKLSASGYTDTNHFSVGESRFLRLDRDGLAGRAEAHWNPSARLQLDAGAEVDVTRTRFDIQFTRPPREGDPMPPNFSEDVLLQTKGEKSNPDLGAWIGARSWPVRELELALGVRVDSYRRNEDTVAQPRGQLKWQVSDGTTLRAAAGLYSRPPEDLDENLQDDLQAERAIQSSLSGERRLRPGLTVQLTGFYNDLRELVVLDGNRRDTASMDGYVNRGDGRSYGMEALLRLRRSDFFGWLAYTGARATRRDAPDQPRRLFDFDQAHNMIAVASWRLGKWQIGGRFQLTTGKPYTPVTSAVYQSDSDGYRPQFGELNSRRVDTQHQLDLRVDRVWQFKNWKLSGYLDIANTYFNAAVVDYSYNYDYSARQKITTLPILPSLGLRGEL
jgi:TonB-dependent Receptor Plug Domain